MDSCETPSLEAALADVVLRARQDLEISRHVFAGSVTYILRDPITFESHRFSPMDYEIFVSMSTGRTLREVLDELVENDEVDLDSKEEYYQFAANLVRLGLLVLPASDGKSLFERAELRRRAVRSGMLKNFLFQQIPLFNPDRFLDATIHWARFLFSRAFLVTWAVGLIAAIWIVLSRWSDFTDPLADILTLKNIPLLWAILFGLKVIHEFGHAYACKHYGGSVPAMGVYLIAGNPCAFVDASAAWGFPNRWHRVFVSLGGMYFESILGIVAVFTWAFSSSAVVQSCAHHIVFMATVVTLLFNANPLMKYDGYFVLCDLTGSPNLRQRSTNALNSLLKRYFLGIGEDTVSLTSRSITLIVYGIACSIYKFFVVISISSMVAAKFAALGLAMAAFYVVSTIYGLYSSALGYLWTSEEVRPVHKRARTLGFVVAASAPLLLLMPVPTAIRSTGRLSVENEFEITNEVAGTIQEVFARNGLQNDPAKPLVRLTNDNVVSQLVKDRSQFQGSMQSVSGLEGIDRIEAQKVAEQAAFYKEQLNLTQHQLDSLNVRSDQSGFVISCLPHNETGKFLPEGSTVAVIGSGKWQARFVTDAETMMAAQPEVGQVVPMRLKSQPGRLIEGTITHIAKAGDHDVDESLTHLAGGDIAVNPVTLEADQPYFEIVVELNDHVDAKLLPGQTIEVRMNRRLELVAQSVYRTVTNFINRVKTG